jgi:two-component system nitrate/nitrite response regulator NarL
LQQGSTPIRVFLISGHRILLWGLQQLIKANELPMQLVGSATSGADAIAAIAAASPDVILLDLDLPDVHPQDISAFASGCSARVLVMTGRDDQSLHDKAVLEGARGVLTRQASPESFLEAIAKVNEGQLWLDRAATGRIFVERRAVKPARLRTRNPPESRPSLSAKKRSLPALRNRNPLRINAVLNLSALVFAS